MDAFAAGPLAEALRSALAAHVAAPVADITGRIPSAVCLPIVEIDGALETWIIRRPSTMRDHSGEWGFPGGKAEPSDRDLAATAVRETLEELGVEAHILGALAPIPIATSRFALHPFVGQLASGTVPHPNAEVAEVLHAPLRGFFDGTFAAQLVDVGAYRAPMFRLPTGRIYGASAWALNELLLLVERVTGVPLPAPEVTTEVPWRR